MKKIFWLGAILLLGVLLVDPCNAASEESAILTVARGDALSTLCRRYLKNPQQWPEVARLNRLSNPELIFPGQQLRVPVRLLRAVPTNGIVTFAKGEVMILVKETPQWRPLQEQAAVPEGSTIKTGPDSTLEVTFDDGTSLLLHPDTMVGLGSATTRGVADRIYDFFLPAGRAISKVRSATGQQPRYQIHTPSAVAAVRGTRFRTVVDPDDATRFEVLQGMVGVAARKNKVILREGEGTVVEKSQPPKPPHKLLAPPELLANLTASQFLPLRLAFALVPGASGYRVTLGRDAELRDLLRNQVIAPATELILVNLEDGVYFLQTQSIDAFNLEGPASPPHALTVRMNPLPPFIQTPTEASRVHANSVLLSWLTVADAACYHIQVAKDRDFQELVEDRSDVTETRLQTGDLSANPYFFRIRSIAADNYAGAWSDPINFSVVPPPPGPPIEQPVADDETMHIRWLDLGPGITYHFQMAKGPDFSEMLFDARPDRPEVTIPKPTEPGTYYVRTSALDQEGYEGVFSKPQHFEVATEFPYLGIGAGLAIILGIILAP